eukprot:2330050-Amphidinium_carterae.1
MDLVSAALLSWPCRPRGSCVACVCLGRVGRALVPLLLEVLPLGGVSCSPPGRLRGSLAPPQSIFPGSVRVLRGLFPRLRGSEDSRSE